MYKNISLVTFGFVATVGIFLAAANLQSTSVVLKKTDRIPMQTAQSGFVMDRFAY